MTVHAKDKAKLRVMNLLLPLALSAAMAVHEPLKAQPVAAEGQAPALQVSPELAADLLRIERLIAAAETDRPQFEQGALRILIDAQLQTLRAAQALLLHREAAVATRVDFASLFATPRADAVARARRSLDDARERAARAEANPNLRLGGLVQSIALLTLATAQQEVALAELAALATQLGFLMFTEPPETIVPTAEAPVATLPAPGPERTVAAEAGRVPSTPQQAENSSRAFDSATIAAIRERGDVAEGDWSISRSRSPMDDSPRVTAFTFAIGSSSQNIRVLSLACVEGQTRLVVDPKDYLLDSNDAVRVTYRIDQRPPVNTSWSVNTRSDRAGIWGTSGFPLIRQMAEGTDFLIRITERNNSSHQMLFSLTGFAAAAEAVAAACNWSLRPQQPQRPSRPPPR